MPDLTALPAIAYEFRFVALIAVCIVALARLFYIAAEKDLRGIYERLGIPWTDAEAAELEAGVREDLHMPDPDPVVEFPLPEYGDDLAWQRLLMAVEGCGPATAAHIARAEAEWIDAEWEHFNERSAG